MSKHYGGTVNKEASSSSAAPGAWIGRNVTRQMRINEWPLSFTGLLMNEEGDYAFAISSGVRDTNCASPDIGGKFFETTGADVSRTDYSGLFSVLGTTYGVGDGFNTFTLPDTVGEYTYTKTLTASGTPLASLSGTAVLPHHTHTVTGVYGTASWGTSCGSAGGNNRNMNPGTNGSNVGAQGSPDGNHGKHRQVCPMIAHSYGPIPIGCVFPYTLPIIDQDFAASNLPEHCVIASGQDVSRTIYEGLFKHVGTLYGSGDGSTTFGLPDFRGIFLNNTGAQPSGISDLPSGYIVDSYANHDHAGRVYNVNNTNDCNGPASYTGALAAPATGNSSVGTTTENRPVNVSVIYALRLA